MRLRVPTVIPITEFAIGDSLPEQSLSPLSSGTGFRVEGNLGGSRFKRNATTLADCRAPLNALF
jgi:hypothetical protein